MYKKLDIEWEKQKKWVIIIQVVGLFMFGVLDLSEFLVNVKYLNLGIDDPAQFELEQADLDY